MHGSPQPAKCQGVVYATTWGTALAQRSGHACTALTRQMPPPAGRPAARPGCPPTAQAAAPRAATCRCCKCNEAGWGGLASSAARRPGRVRVPELQRQLHAPAHNVVPVLHAAVDGVPCRAIGGAAARELLHARKPRVTAPVGRCHPPSLRAPPPSPAHALACPCHRQPPPSPAPATHPVVGQRHLAVRGRVERSQVLERRVIGACSVRCAAVGRAVPGVVGHQRTLLGAAAALRGADVLPGLTEEPPLPHPASPSTLRASCMLADATKRWRSVHSMMASVSGSSLPVRANAPPGAKRSGKLRFRSAPCLGAK